MIHPLFLIGLCIPVLIALITEWKAHRNRYVLYAAVMTFSFMSVYIYIGFVDPPIEYARQAARLTFVFMWSIGAFGAVQYFFSKRPRRYG